MLRNHLLQVVATGQGQPVIYGADVDRLCLTPEYAQNANADNVHILHGREIRKVAHATGGMGCVLQLSLAGIDDPEGWTTAEIVDYNGWAHDSKRPWRRAGQHKTEGFHGFESKYGSEAYSLHHRFYLHVDHRDHIWLAAEDGCEGAPTTGTHR